MSDPFSLRNLMDELAEEGASARIMAIVGEIVAQCLGHRRPKTGAERVAESRDRKRCNECNVDVTQKEKVAPKEKINPPDTLRVSTPKGVSDRGKRLPEGWHPTENHWESAKKLGLSEETLRFETNAFRDHFWSSARANAVKRDWGKAWLNWMREAWRREKKQKPKAVEFKPSGPKRTWAEIRAEKEAQ